MNYSLSNLKTLSHKFALVVAASSLLSLQACSGGGGGGGNEPAEQPSAPLDGEGGSTGGSAGGEAPATPTATPQTSNVSVVGNCTLTTEENELITAHNTARAQSRQCGSEGSFAAVAPLEWHCLLGTVARNHSTDMATVNFFSHTGSDGLSPFDRMRNIGYEYRTAGENVAANQQSVAAVMDAWLESDGHCANVMKPEFTQMGGSRVNSTTADYSAYWTVAFGASR